MSEHPERFHSKSQTWTFEELWNRQLDLQVRVFFPADKEHLESLSGFKEAKSVLEIGSGNGAFLVSLAKAFPGKTYRGIDASAVLTKHARLRTQYVQDVDFAVKDLYALGPEDGRYDFIFARLVVQHLPDLPRFMEIASQLLAPGGRLVVIEAEDEEFRLNPPCPKVESMLSDVRKRQPAGGPKAALAALKRSARKHGFSIAHDQVVGRTLTGSSKSSVRQLWENTARLVDVAYKLRSHTPELRKQLGNWETKSGSQGHFGYRYFVLRKQGSRLALWFRSLVRVRP